MDDPRSEVEWDAEIEAEFQSVVARKKAAGRRKRGLRFIGGPIAFLAEVRRSTEGAVPLVVALLIYRRTCVCRSPTVTLPRVELAELGIDRSMKRKALMRLAAAGLIRVEWAPPGRSAAVTLLWKPK